jgi:glucokinase
MLALPGLVNESTAKLTNLPWVIHKKDLIKRFGIKNVYFMNDFQASAYGTGLMQEKDRVTLNRGASGSSEINHNGISVAVGAGTGLGVAWVQSNQQGMQAYDTEGGHIDFAPVNEQQIHLLEFLSKRFEHVSYERILSGQGMAALYTFCSGKQDSNINAAWVNGHANEDQAASNALVLFTEIYGAYIGNIAVLFKPSNGIYITGGIAAKILQYMQSDAFKNAYLNKGRMRTLVEKIAVYLVTNERIGVLGAMSETIKYCRNQDGQEKFKITG